MTSSADGAGGAARGHAGSPTGAPGGDAHDRRVVRRATTGGGVTALVIGGLLAVGLAPAGGRGLAAALLLGAATGGLVAALWSLAAVALDVLADRPPGRRRLVWTALLVVGTLLAGVLGLGATSA